MHDLNAGRIHVMVATLATMNTPLETGAARLLAVTNSGRVETAPDVPTAREAGFPTLTVDGLFGFFGWRGMLPELRQRIAADVRHATPDRALASRLANVGLIVTAGTADELAVAIAEQRKQVDEIASTRGSARVPVLVPVTSRRRRALGLGRQYDKLYRDARERPRRSKS